MAQYMHILNGFPATWCEMAHQITYPAYRAPMLLRGSIREIRNDQRRSRRQVKKFGEFCESYGYIRIKNKKVAHEYGWTF